MMDDGAAHSLRLSIWIKVNFAVEHVSGQVSHVTGDIDDNSPMTLWTILPLWTTLHVNYC